MNERVSRVLNGYLNLPASERRELINEISKFESMWLSEQEDFKVAVLKSLSHKPTETLHEGSCPCCGK